MSTKEEYDLFKLFTESLANDNVLMLGTTVDTGFEWEATDECKEKFDKNATIVRDRGKIFFNVPKDQFPKIQEMRSIDNIFIVANVQKFNFSGTNKESDLKLFYDAVHSNMDLKKCLDAWKELTDFQGKIYPTKEESDTANKEHKSAEKPVLDPDFKGKKRGSDPSKTCEDDILRYRVTCERTGKHAFESGEIARVIGGELQDKYHWVVDLTGYHLEVYCKLVKDELVTQLRLTHESKHRRNIVAFGPTTLRATVCYNLLRLAHPKKGEIIMDPMCGGGSIPIEAVLAYPYSHVLCGDNHPKAVLRAKSNIDTSTAESKIDLLYWSAFNLPLPQSSIDIIVSDMPFGKRSGTKVDNRVLYKNCLIEFGRVLKPSTSRMVLLTYDRHSFNQAMNAAGNLFWVTKMLGVNIGGLQAAVYVMKRTETAYEKFKPRTPTNYNSNQKH